MTVYKKMLNLPEDIQKHIWCDLFRKRIYYKSEVVFDQGRFRDYSIALPLISLSSTECNTNVWKQKVARLYQNYRRCIPKYAKIHNFRSADSNTADYFRARDSFHQDRLALELYILFHGVQNDLQWENSKLFYEAIAENCIIYRDWLRFERSFL